MEVKKENQLKMKMLLFSHYNQLQQTVISKKHSNNMH